MARPPLPHEIALAEDLLPGPGWASGTVEEGGQSHLVLVARGEAVLRMARTAQDASDLGRRAALVDALAPQLPFRLPRTLAPLWRDGGQAAVVQEYVPGAAHPPHTAPSGGPGQLAALVRELAAVDVEPLRPLLAGSRTHRGAVWAWDAEKTTAVLTALPRDLAGPAARIVEAVRGFPAVRAGAEGAPGTEQPPELVQGELVHGDLAGHNMHWLDGTLVGILDWDLAAAWDPALNAAHLGLWHGRDLLPEIARDPGEAARAAVWIGAIGLDGFADAAARTDNPHRREARLGKLLRKVGPRILAADDAVEAALGSVAVPAR